MSVREVSGSQLTSSKLLALLHSGGLPLLRRLSEDLLHAGGRDDCVLAGDFGAGLETPEVQRLQSRAAFVADLEQREAAQEQHQAASPAVALFSGQQVVPESPADCSAGGMALDHSGGNTALRADGLGYSSTSLLAHSGDGNRQQPGDGSGDGDLCRLGHSNHCAAVDAALTGGSGRGPAMQRLAAVGDADAGRAAMQTPLAQQLHHGKAHPTTSCFGRFAFQKRTPQLTISAS